MKMTKSRSEMTVEERREYLIKEIWNKIKNVTAGDLQVGERFYQKLIEIKKSNSDARFGKRQLDEIWQEVRKILGPGFVMLRGSKKRPRGFG
jgi:hypothetical protein